MVRRTLAKKYGVSVLPIIEACFRLEMDGLVENSPLLGAYVIDVSQDKTGEELILREAIECQAARQYALCASDRDRRHLLKLAEFLDQLAEKLDPQNHELEMLFQRYHSEFHNEIAKLSRAKLIYQQMKKVWYRRLMLVCNVNTALFPNPKGWHVQLTTALNSDDPDAAEKEMRYHVQYNREKNSDSVREVLRRGRMQLLESIMGGLGEAEAGEPKEEVELLQEEK